MLRGDRLKCQISPLVKSSKQNNTILLCSLTHIVLWSGLFVKCSCFKSHTWEDDCLERHAFLWLHLLESNVCQIVVTVNVTEQSPANASPVVLGLYLRVINQNIKVRRELLYLISWCYGLKAFISANQPVGCNLLNERFKMHASLVQILNLVL